VQVFVLWQNNLVELPDLPSTLKILQCSENNLTELPELPNTLKYLDCSYNRLSSFLHEMPCASVSSFRLYEALDCLCVQRRPAVTDAVGDTLFLGLV
jgi:hypothetical protein